MKLFFCFLSLFLIFLLNRNVDATCGSGFEDYFETISNLSATLEGYTVTFCDPEYNFLMQLDEFTLEKKPFFIIRVASDEDVSKSVLFFKNTLEWQFTIRSGGHNTAGYASCGDYENGDYCGIIDMRLMTGLSVDKNDKSVVVEAGNFVANLTWALQEENLWLSFGLSQNIGIGGHITGGGWGIPIKKQGLTIDSVLNATVVLADGSIVNCDKYHHPLLYWAIRGGGGLNFGVITRYGLRVYDMPREDGKVLRVTITYQPTSINDTLYRTLMEKQFDSAFSTDPRTEHYEAIFSFNKRGTGPPSMTVHGMWTGADFTEGEEWFHEYWIDDFSPVSVSFQEILYKYRKCSNPECHFTPDQVRRNLPARTAVVEHRYEIDKYLDGGFQMSLDYLENCPQLSGLSCVLLWNTWSGKYVGTAVSDVGKHETVFPHRNTLFDISLFAGWADPALTDAAYVWMDAFYLDLVNNDYIPQKQYVNYMSPLGEDQNFMKNYYGSNRFLLKAVKCLYDWKDHFTSPQAVNCPF